MSKSILLLDEMPENCYKCRFLDWFIGCTALGEEVYFDEAPDEYYPIRDYRCPLKHLPKKREIKKDDEENMKHFKQGFNDAISIIEGTLIQTFDNDGEENE